MRIRAPRGPEGDRRGGPRRILGSIYGSSLAVRNFPVTLELYRAGRLPLDRLISHRLPLGQIEHAFALMKSGDALRLVLDLSSP